MLRLWILLALLQGCGAGEDLSAPISGTLEVTTSTAGSPSDPSAYAVRVDGVSHPIGFTDTLALPDLSAADHEVELAGVPGNCATEGKNPRVVTLAPNATTRLAFRVSCSAGAPGGDLTVSIATSGSAPDPDGYSLLVDDAPGQPVRPDDEVVLADLTGGVHRLRLADIAPGCEVRDANPRTINIPEADQTRFEVTCVPPVDGVIAYTSDRVGGNAVMDIFLRNGDGTSLRNITNTPDEDEREPVWSPDGRQIAFVPFEQTGIFVMDADGNNRRLLVGGLASVTGVRWSPDGSRLLFVKLNGAFMDELTTYTFSTNQLRVLAQGPSTGFLSGYCWSPDGGRVAYGRVEFGPPGPLTSSVSTVSAGGGTPAVVAAVSVAQQTVQAWSPDGGTIAYLQRQSDQRNDIFLVAADGTGPPVNLTNSPALYGELTWSPDSQALAYSNGSFFEENLFTITRTGAIRQLTELPSGYSSLSWSRDGSRLLFVQSFDIYFINFDGTGRRAVTADEFLNSEASWRP